MSWWIIFAGVVVNWGMVVSKTEQKIGRGKWSVSTSERKFDSNSSFYLNNAFAWPF